MTITLYWTSSPPNKLNKELSEVATVEVILKDNVNVISPVIRLSANYLMTAFNYAYILEFDRYYYVNGKGVLIGKLAEYTFTVDVLMSWRAAINNTPVIAARSTNNGNKQLPDTIPVLSKRNVIYKRLEGGIYKGGAFGSDKTNENTPCMLLTVINGRGTAPEGVPVLTGSVDGVRGVLTWTTLQGAQEYWVYRQKPGDVAPMHVQTVRAVEEPGWTDGATWTGDTQYKVCAVSDGALGAFSNIVTLTYT